MAMPKTDNLKNSIIDLINRTTPIKGKDGKTLTIEDINFTMPSAADDINKQLVMKYSKNDSLEGYIGGKIVIRDAKGEIISKSGLMRHLIPVPIVTERDTYIVNGTEKNILSQMRLKPGIYTSKTSAMNDIKTNIMVDNSFTAGKYVPQMTIQYSPASNDFVVSIKGRKQQNFNGINFLRALGFQDADIKKMLGNGNVSDQLFEKYGKRSPKTIGDIYTAIMGVAPGPKAPMQMRVELFDYLKDNAKFGTGIPVVQASLGLKEDYLSPKIIAGAVTKTFSVFQDQTEEDDKDDLRFKDVYDDNDFILEQIEKDWTEFVQTAQNILDNGKKDIRYTDVRTTTKIGQTLSKFMSSSSIVQTPEETNPLFMAGMSKKITQLGEGGLSSDAARNEWSARNLAANSMNRIDPIETPESGNIGLVEHLTQSAIIENRTIKAPVLKVVSGVAKAIPSNEVYLSPDEEYDTVVAFNDSRYITVSGNKLQFTKNKVPARKLGKITEVPISEVKYVDRDSRDVMGYAANLIPFVAHDDGNRALMGANMQKQAIILKNREVPLVGNMMDASKNLTYEKYIGEQYGKPVRSDIAGEVQTIKDGKIVIKGDDGKKYSKNFFEYYPLNQSFINNEVVVKPGDKVKSGDLLAEGWQTKDGSLALGLNAKVAFLPFKGYNYEDGIVIKRSFANRMATEEMDEQTVEISRINKGGRGSSIMSELVGYTSVHEFKNRLDEDGIIKVGEKVKPGDILVATLKPMIREGSSDYEEAILAADKNLNYRFNPIRIESSSYVEGVVKRVTVIDNPDASNKQKIIITLVNSKPLKIGDKISGRHGNKGTITKILDDEEMPILEDNTTPDLLFSPLAVPSRKNVGQVLEVNAGLASEKTGKAYNVMNFDHKEKDRVLQALKDIGYTDGKMKVYLRQKDLDGSIKQIPVENPITAGNMYIMKLKHKADDKIQARYNLETDPSRKSNMPSKKVGSSAGEKHNPQSLGEMEMRALQGHQAVWNILESSTIKSDGGGDAQTRIAMYNAISTGKLDSLDMPATPMSLKVMSDSLKVLGLNVKPLYNGKEVGSFDDVFDNISIQPMKSSEFIKMVGKNAEVKEPKLYTSKDTHGEASKSKKKSETKEDVPVIGGLMDPKIFGEKRTLDERKKWGFVKLAVPLPNPVLMQDSSYNPYVLLTGMKTKELQELTKGKKVLILDPDKYTPFDTMPASVREKHKQDMDEAGLKPGSLVAPEEIEKLNMDGKYILWQAGGEALESIMDKVNVEKELGRAKVELQKAQGDKIDKAYKKMKLLTMLNTNHMEASDLMMRYVPVAPTYLRPVNQTDDKKSYIIDDLNKLYGELIKANNPVKADTEIGDLYQSRDVLSAAKGVGNIYNRLTDLTGHTTRKDIKTKKELKGIKDALGSKEGLIRSEMLSKRVDFSGRSVIGVDPMLKMNEVGIPIDMARQMYKPFIIKGLINDGFASNTIEANKKYKALDEDTKYVIRQVAKDRPIMLNRQPSLHKFSIMAFDPVIKETEDGTVVRSMHLNPLVVEGFNADFDGDTMAAHTAVTERANEEAKLLMKPSDNLINPTDGKMIVNVRHEMVLGIYYLTVNSDKPEGSGVTYSDYRKLRKDYKDGLVKARTKISMGNISNVTAGQMMFNLLLPEKYRNFKQTWGKSEIEKMLRTMYRDGEESGWKEISKIKISSIMDDIKQLGFEAATRSGISIGSSDFKKIEAADAIFDKNLTAAKKDLGDTEAALITGWRNAEEEIETELKAGRILDAENPLQIMMASGARANAGQIRRMMVTAGVGMDINKRLTVPVKSSHFDGLSPEEYWIHGKDSRKGMSDRSVSTSAPGEITREVWSAAQDVLIVEKDCKTREGIYLPISNNTIDGRIAAEDIVGEAGTILVKRNQMITRDIRNRLYKDPTIKQAKVRSPLKCKAVGGVCQLCYGAMPQTIQLPKEGTPVGTLASHAMGEPVMQMTMNTFHSGGTGSGATLGLPRIETILNLGKDKSTPAILAKISGTVTGIEKGPAQDILFINGKAHGVPHIDGKSQPLKVSVGDKVVKGDFLTPGDSEDLENISNKDVVFTNADPKELYKLKASEFDSDTALDYVQNYLTNSMDYAFKKTTSSGSIDRRHEELIIGKMTSKAKVLDSGDSHFMKGDEVDRNALIKWNTENSTPYSVRKISIGNTAAIVGRKSGETYKSRANTVIIAKGEVINEMSLIALRTAGYKEIKVQPRLIVFENQLHSKNTIATHGHSNWLSNLGHEDIMSQLARGATLGQVDKLNDPRSRQMTGKLLNVGEGFDIPADKGNGVATRMFNLFGKIK
ncbi:MAG: DNA-directed polymerase, beta subunit [Herbinix sp.]|jgi:DNA-directed RNA polymerase subunit beta'|nr:DNA-directed polymerase, beta subunit [Herbinix sp.]